MKNLFEDFTPEKVEEHKTSKPLPYDKMAHKRSVPFKTSGELFQDIVDNVDFESFTRWEESFMKNMQFLIKRGSSFTPKQEAALKRISEKYSQQKEEE